MKRIVAIGLVSALAAVLAFVILSRPRQTGLGQIKRTTLTESHPPTRLEAALNKAGKILHLSVADTRQRNYLTIGKAQMEWSLMSTGKRTGWLYFDKPESNDALWEFGFCSRRDLKDLVSHDLQVEFVRKGDTNGIRSVFDSDSWLETSIGQKLENGRAIPVREGQVILARLIDSPGTIYAIRLADQSGTTSWGRMSVEYVAVDLNKVEPSGAANQNRSIAEKTNRPAAAAGSGN